MTTVKELLRGTAAKKSKPAKETTDLPDVEVTPREIKFDPGWLQDFLEEAQERGQPLWNKPSKKFRASSSGSLCERDLTFNAMGHNVPFEARVLRIFRVGNKVEEEIVETAKAAKLFVEGSDQLEGVVDDMIFGHVDMIVEHPISNEQFLVEIKSINTHQFKRLPKQSEPVMLAGKSPLYDTHRKYVTQWNTYAWSPEVDLQYGCILFEDKNDQNQKYYWLERDDVLLEQTLSVHRKALEYIDDEDNMMLAPIPINFNPKEGTGDCRWCSHRYLCKRLDPGTVPYEDVRKEDAKLRG